MERRREIVAMREAGLSERQTARRLELPPSTVHYWLAKEDAAEAAETVPRRRKRGRPRVTTEEKDVELYERCVENPFATAVDLRDELAPDVSVDTVRNRLKERNMACRIPARKPVLREIHVRKRMEFATNYATWSREDWRKVLFTDEKIFRSWSRGAAHVYRPRDSSRYDLRYVAPSENPEGRFTVHVWVAIGYDARRIHLVVAPTMNADYYVRNVLPIVRGALRSDDMLFQFDRSPVHQSRLAMRYLEEHNVRTIEDWPPKGPDLNPVENVWAEMVRRLRDVVARKGELWEHVDRVFHELEDAYLNNLIDSMERRIAQLLEVRGQWIKY